MANRTLGKYEIRERLGRGGMAEVFRAYHANLDRFVAIKVLHGFLADDPEFKSRFEKEARNIARLKHPHIVQVYDFDYDPANDSYYMVMELIEGPTLKERLGQFLSAGQLPGILDAVRIVKEAAGALAYAHSQSMVHRDVKPGNLMLDRDNRIVLADFGIAKIVTGAQFTSTGGMVGTPAYMAPEQGLGEPGDERSDLYSLGVIFYQLLTGRLPYDADAPLAVILKHLNEPIPSVRAVRPSVPEDVDNLIVRLMSKDPATRYQTANDLIADLEAVEQKLGTQKAHDQELVSKLLMPAERASTRTSHSVYLAQGTPRITPRETVDDAAALPVSTDPAMPRSAPRLGGSWRLLGLVLLALTITVVGAVFANGDMLLPFVAGVPTETATATLSPTTAPPAVLSTEEATATEDAAEQVSQTPALLTLTPRAPVIENLPTRAPSVTVAPSLTLTTAVPATAEMTITASPTRTVEPTRTLSPTRTAQPTRTATPTATPTHTVQPLLEVTQTLVQATRAVEVRQATLAACIFNYAIVDQKPGNGEYFPTSSPYVREIVLRNTGSCAWERNSSLNYVSGESFSAGPRIFIRERVEPGAEYVLLFEGQTPTQGGIRTGMWELRTTEFMQIGQPFEISIYAYSQGK